MTAQTTAVTVTIDGTTHHHMQGREWLEQDGKWLILDRHLTTIATYPVGHGAIIRREVQS